MNDNPTRYDRNPAWYLYIPNNKEVQFSENSESVYPINSDDRFNKVPAIK